MDGRKFWLLYIFMLICNIMICQPKTRFYWQLLFVFGDVTLRNVLLYIANLFFIPIILMPMLELMIMFAPFIFIRDEE